MRVSDGLVGVVDAAVEDGGEDHLDVFEEGVVLEVGNRKTNGWRRIAH